MASEIVRIETGAGCARQLSIAWPSACRAVQLELTPFHGHRIVQQEAVQDGQTAYPQAAVLGAISSTMVELVQAGRNPNELAREFGCHVTSILSWVSEARLGLPAGIVPLELPLAASERQELLEPRRKVRQLQMER